MADAPAASVPTAHVEPVQPLPRDSVAETSVAAGDVLARKVMPVAVSGPAFVIVAVQVAFSPTCASDGAFSVSCTSVFGGTGGGGAFHVTVASFDVVSNRGTKADTWSVPVFELEYVNVACPFASVVACCEVPAFGPLVTVNVTG